jgi:hypothetical protein
MCLLLFHLWFKSNVKSVSCIAYWFCAWCVVYLVWYIVYLVWCNITVYWLVCIVSCLLSVTSSCPLLVEH